MVMVVEKNVDANVQDGQLYQYFDEDRGEWVICTLQEDRIVSLGLDTITQGEIFWEYATAYKKRLHCEYCGCISEKDHGTCEHCGAPLKEME